MDVPLEMVIGGRTVSEPRVSPDGSTIAFVASWGSESAIVSVPAAGGPERIMTATQGPAVGRGPFGGNLAWLDDGSALVMIGADGNLWRQPAPGGPAQMIAEIGPERRPGGLAVTADRAVVEIDHAEIWWFAVDGSDAQRLDHGGDDFVADPHIVAGSNHDRPIVQWSAWNIPDMAWDAAATRELDIVTDTITTVAGDGSTHQPRSFADGRRLAVRDDHGFLNVWLDDQSLVPESYEHSMPTWSSGQRSYAPAPTGDRVAFWRNEGGYGTLNVVDVASRDVTTIDRGTFSHLDWRGGTLAALRSGARTPPQIVTYRDGSFDRQVIAYGSVAGWDRFDLPEPELVETSGEPRYGRRYVAGNGRMLVWVHGGPTGQWPVEWNPKISYWWSRGWDVLVVDPRGSTGYGRHYQQSLNGQWGVADVDDTAQLIEHAHAAGWARPATTVLMGGSSGGLTVLGVAARHGHLLAGGVAMYPVTDLQALAEGSHRYEAHYTIPLVGPPDDSERYWHHSPMSSAEQVKSPLLIMHGSDDPVVPATSTIGYVERVRNAGGDVEFHLLEGEGHGFRSNEARRFEYDRIGSFLRRVVIDRDPTGAR